MLRTSLFAGFLAAGLHLSAAAVAAEPAPVEAPATPAYSTEGTDIGTLLDNPETKTILDKHLPTFASNPQIEMARAMTLKQIQSFAADDITDEVLTKIDADLAKLPPKK